MTGKIRPLNYTQVPLAACHGQGVMAVFNFYITESHAAFPDKPVTDAFFQRFLDMSRGYPAKAVMADEVVVGFGFLRPYHWADTFRRTAEITYFLHPEHTRCGIGTWLLESLCQEARQQGIAMIVASLSSRNLASLAFHLKNGFEICGTLKGVGQKFGQDFDVVLMQKALTVTEGGLEGRPH